MVSPVKLVACATLTSDRTRHRGTGCAPRRRSRGPRLVDRCAVWHGRGVQRAPSITDLVVRVLADGLPTADVQLPRRQRTGGGRVALPVWYGMLEKLAEDMTPDKIALAITKEPEAYGDGLIDVMLASANFREGLRWVVDYQQLLSDESFELVRDGDGMRLCYTPWGAPRSGHHLAALIVVADAIINARQFLGSQFVVDEVTVCSARPIGRDFADALQAKVRYGQPQVTIRLPASTLALPMPKADALHVSDFVERVRRDWEALGVADIAEDFVDQARLCLHAELLAGQPTLAMLADRMGVSRRTLQRRLHDAGLSWRQLLDQLRLQFAQESLSGGCTVSETAAQLGFSEASAFYRAYRRWTGHSPRGVSATAE